MGEVRAPGATGIGARASVGTRVGQRDRARRARGPRSAPTQWRPLTASDADSRVRFTAAWLARLREAAPARVALLITSEYEGVFRNGGVGTYYRRLSEQLTAEGWHVLLLLTLTDGEFRGESAFPGARHLFSTREVEQVLDLQPLHRRMLSARTPEPFDHQSLCALFFAQAVVDAFPDAPVYIEFPEMMGTGYHTIHARQTGLLGHRCVIGVTLHGGHEWVSDANERYVEDDPSRFEQVAWYESFSFEHADLSFFPSHFLRARMESYGWTASHAIHLPYLIPLVDWRASSDNGLPQVGGGKRPVVFFGRLEERKGLCTFLAAVRALPPRLRQGLHVVFLGKVVGLHRAPLAHLNSRGYIEQEAPDDLSYRIVPDLYSEDALQVRGGPRQPDRVPGQPAGELPEQRPGDGTASGDPRGVGYRRLPRGARARPARVGRVLVRAR